MMQPYGKRIIVKLLTSHNKQLKRGVVTAVTQHGVELKGRLVTFHMGAGDAIDDFHEVVNLDDILTYE